MNQIDTLTGQLVGRLEVALINPLLELIFVIGLLVFVWGVFDFMWGLSGDVSEKKENGKKHMLWGVVGMFVMTAAYAIIQLVSATFQGLLSQ